MSFWGGVLSPGKPLTYTPPPSFVLTVNLAALVCDEAGSRAPHRVCVETAHDDSVRRKLVLCTLRPGRVEQQRLDLLFGWDHEATWSVEGGSGSVHLTGYLSAVEAGDVAVGSGPASADMMALAHGALINDSDDSSYKAEDDDSSTDGSSSGDSADTGGGVVITEEQPSAPALALAAKVSKKEKKSRRKASLTGQNGSSKKRSRSGAADTVDAGNGTPAAPAVSDDAPLKASPPSQRKRKRRRKRSGSTGGASARA